MKQYLLAVSGGVDSVLMLDEMAASHDVSKILVMHFDHGIRDESHWDARFVEALAQKYGVDFVIDSKTLGKSSENTARQARWVFFRETQRKFGGVICTAHHQDDVLETMIMNLQRGTGWRGLVSLRETDSIHRPLIGLSKSQIRHMAVERRLEWLEDVTNQSRDYTRNRVRHDVVSKLHASERQQFLDINARLLKNLDATNKKLQIVADQITTTSQYEVELNRADFSSLPLSVQLELIIFVVRRVSPRQKNFTRQHWEEAVNFIGSKPTGKELQLPAGLRIRNISKSQSQIIQASL